MLFKGKVTAYVFMKENRVIVDNKEYSIYKVNINTPENSRFSFGEYEAKISRDILTLTNTSNGIVYSLNRDLDYEMENQPVQELWERFLVYGEYYVYISNDKKTIKTSYIDNLPVLSSRKQGICMVYRTSNGELSISDDELVRPSTWKYINITRT